MTFRIAHLPLLLAACDQGSVEVGEIQYDRGQPRIEATTPARAGDPVFMTVWTIGGGCVSLDSTEITATEDGGDLTPYDRDSGDSLCTADLRFLPHEGLFTFETAGTKTIRVHGRRRTAGTVLDPPRDELFEIPVRIIIE